MKKRAIVRPPSKSFRNCISVHPQLKKLDLELALIQHKTYCDTLHELGLELIELPPEDEYPDSCFVEDAAIIHGEKAVITRPAKHSRRGEVVSVHEVLKQYKRTRQITSPGTIEGGDVIHLENSIISGLTKRTNHEGIEQASIWLDKKIDIIEDSEITHLKSYITYIGKQTFVTTDRFVNHPLLEDSEKIIIPEQEVYAANTLTYNDVVLMSMNHRDSIKMVEDAGFDVIPLDLSEFEKCEGALTCLSIIF